MKRFYKISLFTILFIFLTSYSIMAAGTYIKDDASVINNSTIQQINTNLDKLKTNTGAVVRFQTIQSLNGKNIVDIAKSVGSSTGTDKWAVMVVSIQDHKTQFVVGNGLNAVFNSNEISRIAHIPDQYFKSKDFNGGLLAAGQAIDQDITTKAVSTGNAVVKTNGMSTTVSPKTPSHFGTIAIIVVLTILVVGLVIILMKKKSDRDMKKFEDKVNYHPSGDSGTFRSASLNSDTGWDDVKPLKHTPNYAVPSTPSHSNHSSHKTHTTVNHTTVVNGSNNNGFVEGMLVNEMLHDHDHHEHHSHHDDDYSSGSSNWESNNDDNSPSFTSSDWNSSGSSGWSSDNSSSSWDSGSSDWGGGSSGGSDW